MSCSVQVSGEARSRFAEDHLARAVGGGVRQYALFGAGLDTFCFRKVLLPIELYSAVEGL